MPDDRDIDAPVSLQGLWPDSSDSDSGDMMRGSDGFDMGYETQEVDVAGRKLKVRQYVFHSHNANRVWPGTFNLAEHYLGAAGGEGRGEEGGARPRGDLRELVGRRVLEVRVWGI